MINFLPLYIGLRYLRAKQRNGFISFIAFASTTGIALGVMVLITVLSVMNGFDRQIRQHFFATAPQITVSTEEDIADHWQQLANSLKQLPQVNGVAPYISDQGMLIHDRRLHGVNVQGILPNEEIHIAQWAAAANGLSSLIPDSFNVVMSQSLADQLGLQIGDTVNLFTAQAATTPLGLFPRYRQLHISGLYQGENTDINQSPVYLAMADAQKLFAAANHQSGLHLQLNDPYQAQSVSEQIRRLLPSHYSVTNWAEESGALFQALAMEKVMMFIILLLIIAIAAFNLIAMLVMVVHEKQADIAILRTLGATPKVVRNIFIIQGSILGVVGTFAGLIAGIILAWNINPVVNTLQRWFHVQFIPTSVYWPNYLPVQILPQDVIEVCLIALGLSVLATLYPALVAFRIQPAEALRYE